MFNEHPIELGLKGHEAEVVRRFEGDAARRFEWRPRRRRTCHAANIVKAIAAFERTLVSGDSPLDRYLYRDDKTAMSAAALARHVVILFQPLRCAECHGSFNLSGPVDFDGRRDSQGDRSARLSQHWPLRRRRPRRLSAGPTAGLFDITNRAADMGRFRAPTLRNIAMTAPYMHDGSVPTLEARSCHYAIGGHAQPVPERPRPRLPDVADGRADLVAFLESLTDQSFLTNPSFAAPNDRGTSPAKTARQRPNEHGVPQSGMRAVRRRRAPTRSVLPVPDVLASSVCRPTSRDVRQARACVDGSHWLLPPRDARHGQDAGHVTAGLRTEGVGVAGVGAERAAAGMGRGSGGDGSPQPARPALLVGRDAITVPVATPPRLDPSNDRRHADAATDIPAVPVASGLQEQVGAVAEVMPVALTRGPGSDDGVGGRRGGGWAFS